MSTIPTGEGWGGFTPPPDGPYQQPGVETINEYGQVPEDLEDLLVVEEPEPEPEPVKAAEPEVEEEPPPFDPRYKEDLIGLQHIGYLEETFDWVGHDIRIRTLTDDEELICGVLVKEWQGTVSEIKAYQTAVVGACIITVDGKPIYQALGQTDDNPEARIRGAMDYVRRNWFALTIDRIFTEYLDLERRVREVVEAMGKVSSA